jgi:hypothetical protein
VFTFFIVPACLLRIIGVEEPSIAITVSSLIFGLFVAYIVGNLCEGYSFSTIWSDITDGSKKTLKILCITAPIILICWLIYSLDNLGVSMFIDQHPYLSIYLLGSLLVILLAFMKIPLFYMIDWFTKELIAIRNLEKLNEPDNKAWYLKILIFLGSLVPDVALSWVGVILVFGQIIYLVIKVLRDVFTSVPEEIKVLEYPLRNNPLLTKEAVWVYVMALCIKKGEALQNENAMVAEIEKVLDSRPDFNCENALDQLDNLKVMNSEIISSVKSILAEKHGYQE